jgi:hypothetical protein
VFTLKSDRVAIVGTAGSWVNTPWNDPTLSIWSLNDAYKLPGFVRADAWFDLHPLDHFIFATGDAIHAHQVPPGHYVRPQEHLHWLASQSIPVVLHPDWRTQEPKDAHAKEGWQLLLDKPNVFAFPKAEIEAHFGRYFTSSPGWMVAQALMGGCRDLQVYGIHLATEHEYREQRPNFEFLCGALLGLPPWTVTECNGMRRYVSGSGALLLPAASPVLQSTCQYAFEPRPDSYLEPLRWESHKVSIKTARAVQALKQAPFWKPMRKTQEELWRLEAWQADVQEQMQRIAMAERWTV